MPSVASLHYLYRTASPIRAVFLRKVSSGTVPTDVSPCRDSSFGASRNFLGIRGNLRGFPAVYRGVAAMVLPRWAPMGMETTR